METTLPIARIPGGNSSGSDGAIGRAASGVHHAVDKAAATADQAVRNVKPLIARVADGAHQAVDKAVSLAVPTAEWMNEKSESFKATQKKMAADARQYVAANPLRSVAVALAAGWLLGRVLRILR